MKFAVLEVGVHVDEESTLCTYQNLMDDNMEQNLKMLSFIPEKFLDQGRV